MSLVVRSYAAESLVLSPVELWARLRCPPEQMQEQLDIWIPRVCAASVCRACAMEVDISRTDGLQIGPISMQNRALDILLRDCDRAILMAATLGAGVDRLLMQTAVRSPADQFVADAVASALVEALCDRVEEDLCGLRPHTHRFSPGYVILPLEIQPEFLKLLDAHRQIGIALTDRLLMTPTKSVTAILGLRNPT